MEDGAAAPEPLLHLPGALGPQCETYRRGPTLIAVPKAARVPLTVPADTPAPSLLSSAFPPAGTYAALAAKRAARQPPPAVRRQRAALLEAHRGVSSETPGPATYGELAKAGHAEADGSHAAMPRAARMAEQLALLEQQAQVPGPAAYTPKLAYARAQAPRAVVSSRHTLRDHDHCGPGPAAFVPRRTQGKAGADFGAKGAGKGTLPPRLKGVQSVAALRKWVAVMKAPTMTITGGGLELDARR